MLAVRGVDGVVVGLPARHEQHRRLGERDRVVDLVLLGVPAVGVARRGLVLLDAPALEGARLPAPVAPVAGLALLRYVVDSELVDDLHVGADGVRAYVVGLVDGRQAEVGGSH